MSLDEVADELYGLAPGEFIAARNEQAKAARAAGERELAAEIRALRKPTVVAWLANQLARRSGDDIAALVALGDELRQAMSAPSGPELRRLNTRQRELIGLLMRAAHDIAGRAGQTMAEAASQDLTGTLHAALADPAAAQALTAGRLTEALTMPAFPGMGMGGAPAAAPPPPSPAATGGAEAPEPAPGRDDDALRAERQAQARHEVAEAEDAVVDARRVLRHATAALERATNRAHQAEELVEQLSSELADATAARDRSRQVEQEARSAHEAAQIATRESEKHLREATAALDDEA